MSSRAAVFICSITLLQAAMCTCDAST
jgi:hypothetical protein